MAQEPTNHSIEQSLYRVMAAVEFLTDKTKEISNDGKGRDEKLSAIMDMYRINNDQVKELARAAREQQESTARALSDAKHESRNTFQVVSGRVELLDAHLKALVNSFDAMKAQVDTTGTKVNQLEVNSVALKQTVEELKIPVDQLINLRRHIYAFGALIGSIIGVFWFVGGPMVTWITTHFLALMFPTPEHK